MVDNGDYNALTWETELIGVLAEGLQSGYSIGNPLHAPGFQGLELIQG